ncbi:unnamed protein product [Urochloa humidicola]
MNQLLKAIVSPFLFADVICKTCYRRFEFLHRLTSETPACGHKNAERLCDMCDRRSCVLHPFPDQENVRMPIADTFIATSAEHGGPVWIECIPDFLGQKADSLI